MVYFYECDKCSQVYVEKKCGKCNNVNLNVISKQPIIGFRLKSAFVLTRIKNIDAI